MDRWTLRYTYDYIEYTPTSKEWLNLKEKKCEPFCALIIADGDCGSVQLNNLISGQSVWATCEILSDICGYEASYILGFSSGFDDQSQGDILEQFSDIKDLNIEKFMEGFEAGVACEGLEFDL